MFRAQLASIMEVLASAAVAEILELVDSGTAALRVELSRRHKENEALRRKLRLAELKAARGSALRAASLSCGELRRSHVGELQFQRVTVQVGPRRGALEPSRGPRARLGAPDPSRERLGAPDPSRERLGAPDPSKERLGAPDPSREQLGAPDPSREQLGAPDPSGDAGDAGHRKAVAIKVEEEEDEEDWRSTEQDAAPSPPGAAAEAPPPVAKSEASPSPSGASCSWSGGEPRPLSPPKPAEPDAFDRLRLRHAPPASQSRPPEEPGCSYARVGAPAPSEAGGAGFLFGGDGEDGRRRAAPGGDKLNAASGEEAAAAVNTFPLQAALEDDWLSPDSFSGGPAPSEAPGGRTFSCGFCGKRLACLKNLKTHMRVHTGEKPFGCALCSKRFSDSSNLKRHQSVHTGEKRYGCVQCGKRFAQSGSLKVHMSVHLGCKQFRCARCGKTFISASHLRRHAALHQGGQGLPPSHNQHLYAQQ